MRMLMMAAAVALIGVSATVASQAAAPHTAPYLDAAGKCHSPNGQFAAAGMCKAPAAVAPGRCRDKTTKKFVKCGTPNSEPVPAAPH